MYVFFDDFRVIHKKNAIVSGQDYYPLGLTFNNSDENNIGLAAFKDGENYDDFFGPETVEANTAIAAVVMEELVVIMPGLLTCFPVVLR